jgi:MOSC domain-containing protein YiiM
MSRTEGRVVALSISDRKGVPKTNVPEVELVQDHGIAGDAHAGPWHRQVSLLALESIETMRCKGAKVGPGAFAENITTEGLDLTALQIGDHVVVGDSELEVTQIGKECHDRCAIFEAVGDCVMPREGIFTRVVTGGHVRVGDAAGIRRRNPAA